jgi:hypothetical protein
VNASAALAASSSSPVEPSRAEADLSLEGLLDLFVSEPLDAAAAAAKRPSIRESGSHLRGWAQEWVRRATEWGAGPQGAWRAW